MVGVAVAIVTPMVEVILVRAEALNVGVELVDPSERAGFPSMNGISGAAAGDFAFAIANGHDSGIACFIDVDLVAAGTKHRESNIGRIDFESFVIFEPPHTHVKSAFGDADLRRTVVEIQERKASVAGKANRGGADVEFGA